MDSLGIGHMGAPVMKIIKTAFSSGRLKCRFMEVKCRTQTEVECGPRTVSSMVSICQSLERGHTIEAAIQKGSLDAPTPNGYNPLFFRRKAVAWVQKTEETKNQHDERKIGLRRYMSKRGKENGTELLRTGMSIIIIIIMLSSGYSYIMDFYTEECTVYRSDRTAYWVGVRRFILLHWSFGVLG